MHYYPQSIRQLIKNIARLPGIGAKTAERLAMHVLKAPREEAVALARSLVDVKDKIRFCETCFGLSDDRECNVCTDTGRNTQSVCVVELPADMIAIEKSGAFSGRYHILQGALSPIEGIGPERLRIRELIHRIEQGDITEIILATGTGMEGEATASYLAEQLKPYPLKVTRIASGVPIGGDLKYVDQVTMKKAMDARYTFDDHG